MSGAFAMVPTVSLRRPAEAATVPLMRRLVRDFAKEQGATPDQLFAIALAVTEAVTNAVRHAYPGAVGPVLVDADVEEGDLEIAVRDHGTGFQVSSTPGMGLGLGVIRSLSSAFEVRDHPYGGVEVWMRFPLEA